MCIIRQVLSFIYVKNLQQKIPKQARGGFGGSRMFGLFPEIHPFWCGQASLNLGLLIELVSSGAQAFV